MSRLRSCCSFAALTQPRAREKHKIVFYKRFARMQKVKELYEPAALVLQFCCSDATSRDQLTPWPGRSRGTQHTTQSRVRPSAGGLWASCRAGRGRCAGARWAEAHVGRGAGCPASTGVPWSMHRSLGRVRIGTLRTQRLSGTRTVLRSVGQCTRVPVHGLWWGQRMR